MRIIRTVVPPDLAATAQALYALGPAAATAVLTLVSGLLYARLGGQAFLVMALLCAAATPVALARGRSVSLRPPARPGTRG
jgi:PPP family 3-phenylpropionic acid transporter